MDELPNPNWALSHCKSMFSSMPAFIMQAILRVLLQIVVEALAQCHRGKPEGNSRYTVAEDGQWG